MAKKITTDSSSSSRSVSPAPASSPVSSTAVRNTAIPPRSSSPSASQRKSGPSREEIAKRAYEIWKSGRGGSQDENWFRAERELRGY